MVDFFDDNAKQEIFDQLDKPYISGITFSGGDPLHHANKDGILALAKEIKDKYPKKTMWLYTGYSWNEIYEMELMRYLDVVIDGEFKIEEKDNTLMWKGSKNQKVIDVKATLHSNESIEPILYCDDYKSFNVISALK